MSVWNLLTMIGGLALFLYGMHIMGEGLTKVSGGKMEQVLEKMTDSPLKGVLLGAGVTAVIQSSSATTVMVVGFVNSGIMKLSQAVGVIMGANIGTTVTAWLLSLTGIQSTNIWISLLKPSSFSPILAAIGIIFVLFSKKEKKHDIGTILLGFAILMFGMETMSDAVAPLKDVPAFTNLFLSFQNPFLGMLAGLVLTGIIQSSSASVGILQSLCTTGSVTFGAAFPIIMGQNIGTCVTAMISAIGTSKNAKRAAFVHLYFNIIGTTIFMIAFYTANAIVHFTFLNDTMNAASIAVIHSTFNIVTTCILLPFHKGLEKLATKTVRDNAEDVKEEEAQKATDSALALLDERFLANPSLALENCHSVMDRMAEFTKKALFLAMVQLGNYDKEKADRVYELENTVDLFEDRLGTYLIQVSSRDLTEKDSRSLSMMLHSIGDVERISDHAVNIVEKAQEMDSKGLAFSDEAEDELSVYSKAVADIVDMAFQVLEEHDFDLAYKVEPLEETIDRLTDELKERHYNRLRRGTCSIDMGFLLSDITTNYERVADHCSNIAVDLIQIKDNAFEVHEYLDELKRREDAQFQEEYRKNRQKYALPPIGKDEKTAFADVGEGIGAGTGAGTGKEANAARA